LTRDEERHALASLLTSEAAAVPGGIHGVHSAISGRVFRALGPRAALVRVMHDTIARGSYFGVRAGIAVAGRVAGEAYARRGAERAPRAFSATPRGAAAIAAVNALRGDTLERDANPLALPMSVRRRGEIVPLPSAERLVVFVHGLGETEFAWGRDPYGARLPGWTPVYVRYNTGRKVSDNGASLAALLDGTDAREIALIGHSMGGLVARAACHHGGDWTERVRVTVSLGTPHLGAPLANIVHHAGTGLGRFRETRPFANLLDRRSAGIRDLRHGFLLDEVPLLEGPAHCFVSATVTRTPTHPVGRLVGDTLVLSTSASGRGHLTFHEGLELGGTHHLALLNHPAIHEQLLIWLS
jgi:pimeloyl-ACP methyl ester carboxylesterase